MLEKEIKVSLKICVMSLDYFFTVIEKIQEFQKKNPNVVINIEAEV